MSLLAGCNVKNPSDILKAAQEASSSLLPAKSKEKYQKVYEKFCQWRISKNVQKTDENVVLAYFFEKQKLLRLPVYGQHKLDMLKSTLQINENMDISQYKKLVILLKRQNDTYEAKKSKVLTMENVTIFLKEAPDDKFLLMKVVLIFGLNGACRRAELYSLTVKDIEDTGSECNGYEIYHKYLRLRPKHVKHNRFFIYYNHGKCTVQPVGMNSFAKIPQKVAEHLKLPDASSYTGHCLRRTSATFLADNGADIQTLKRHRGWQSTSVAEGYIEESIGNKLKISKSIFHQQELVAS
ncbi:hypothetical protein NQ315_016709 [Exocentrus adspersus]|uniref:Tyr recombinase domain-containing protein n=1 Tax=Exocentrus adspersus TaxID=1586481 RepID=A0AAV8VF17_9CUCU|nr:hypothetical protein NQ315_016709 [Exocentrus adspersus]